MQSILCKTGNDSYSNRARDMVVFLAWTAPQFIARELWPWTSPDVNPVDYMQDLTYDAESV